MDVLRFDLDVDAGCNVEHLELVDGFWCGAQNIEKADVGADFKLFARFAVHVWRSEDRIDLPFGGEWDRAGNAGSRSFSYFYDIRCGTIEHALIISLQADSDFLSTLLCHVGSFLKF